MTRGPVAIIPARGGSKRLPRKNILELAGVPLIEYTIRAALNSGLFDRVIVSTDDREIADISQQAGAEVPCLREFELADDVTPVSEVTASVVEQLISEGESYPHVCQLMANCPLRDANDIRQSYLHFGRYGARSQISVVRYGWQNPWWAFQQGDDHRLSPLFPEAHAARSQDLPALFCPTGAIWWGRSGMLLKERTFHVDDRTGWEMDWRHGLDIDTTSDWELAEALLGMAHSVDSSEGSSSGSKVD